MISDVFFVLKMFFLTVLIVLVLQIRVGQKTIEDNFHGWVKHSIIVDYAEEAMDGATLLVKRLYLKADSGVHSLLAKTIRKNDKKRDFSLGLKRREDRDDDSRTEPHVQTKKAMTQTL
jgi:hypothetical protein